jgi:ribosomal protein S27AE
MELGDTKVTMNQYVAISRLAELFFKSPYVYYVSGKGVIRKGWVCNTCGSSIARAHKDTCLMKEVSLVKKELGSLLERAGYGENSFD